MAATITVSVPELDVPSFDYLVDSEVDSEVDIEVDSEVAQLRREVAELRRELAELRDALAVEVRTRRIVVADGDRDVTIEPGDVVGDRFDEVQSASVVAWADWDCEPGGPYAEVTVNGDELTRSPG
jgi:hypothetical protein